MEPLPWVLLINYKNTGKCSAKKLVTNTDSFSSAYSKTVNTSKVTCGEVHVNCRKLLFVFYLLSLSFICDLLYYNLSEQTSLFCKVDQSEAKPKPTVVLRPVFLGLHGLHATLSLGSHWLAND